MTICKNCGVEVEGPASVCPLCNANIGETETEKNIKVKEKNKSKESQGILASKNIVWELLSLTFLSGLFVTVFIDLVFHKTLTWSLFSVITIFTSWVYATLVFYSIRRKILFLTGFFINTFSLLFFIDLFNLPVSWSVSIGLPLTLFFTITMVILIYITAKTKHRGFNIIAFFLLGLAIYCLLVEAVINYVHHNGLFFSWSAIVITSIMPICIFLLFFHYRLNKGTDLNKYFHL